VGDDTLDRLLEQLRKARHVDALLRRVEVDRAVDRRGDQLLLRAAADAHRLLHPCHARPREAERDLGRRGLEVVEELARAVAHLCTVPHGPWPTTLPSPSSSRWGRTT